MSYFIELNIDKQLENLLNKPELKDSITSYRFEREATRKCEDMGDIYDGCQYRKLFPNGPLGNMDSLSFLWTTDGIPLFKSSKYGLWPFYLSVNELPPNKHFKWENQILAGLWYGTSKPAMLCFLKPIYQGLSGLEENGIKLNVGNEEKIVKCFVIGGTCDLPAKCLAQNMTQFNGYFGCGKCKFKGVYNKEEHLVVFPFEEMFKNRDDIAKRNSKSFYIDAKQAQREKIIKDGVKGTSWFSCLKSFDIIHGKGIDYMHCVCNGVMKTLTMLWFSSGLKGEKFNILEWLPEIDKILCSLKPPNIVTRAPRKLTENLKHYKASEYRNLLLLFGPFILRDFLPQAYYDHFLMLSEAIHILLLDSITPELLNRAEGLLVNICANMGKLYSQRYELPNFHLLIHLVDSVRQLGPLWTHACFHFENANQFLLKLFHWIQNVVMQIVSALSMHQGIHVLEKMK